MQCKKCGRNLNEMGRCSFCDAETSDEVRVMSRDEKNLYTGITIDESADKTPEMSSNHEGYYHGKEKPFSMGDARHFKFRLSGGNWISTLAVMLLVAAVIGFIIFVALPVALIGVAIGAVVWIILSFLRH